MAGGQGAPHTIHEQGSMDKALLVMGFSPSASLYVSTGSPLLFQYFIEIGMPSLKFASSFFCLFVLM